MKPANILTFILFLLTVSSALAQKGVITGNIVEEGSSGNVPFATVALSEENQSDAIFGTVSDESGSFLLEKIPNGNYTLFVSFIGYETSIIENIAINNQNYVLELGSIELKKSDVELGEVNVSGVRSTVQKKIDRQTYNSSDFATAKGGTAVDVLSKIPSVTVDGDGNVAMRGTSDFMVYINGKPSNTEASVVLSQIPSDNIENIDIITVPTSRYNAQGKGGIININTRRSEKAGLSITANGMIGGTPWKNAQDVYSNQELDNDRYNAGLTLMYSKGKLLLRGALNMQSFHNKGRGIIDPYIYQLPSETTNSYGGMYYVLDGNGSRPKWAGNNMVSAGISYRFDPKSELTFDYYYSERNSGRTANYVYDAYFSDSPTGIPINGTLQKLYNPNDIHRDGWFSNLSMDYKLDISDNSTFSSTLIYESSNLLQTIENHEFSFNGDRYYYGDRPLFHSFQSDETPLKAYSAAFNFATDLGNGDLLSVGLQPQWVRLDGDFKYDTIVGNAYYGNVESYNNSIELKRDIYAAYIDYSGKSGGLSYIIGVRLEYLDQLMNVESTSYFEYVYGYFSDIGDGRDFSQKDFVQKKFDLFPTIHLGYDFNDLNSLSLAASRRVNRPPAKDMAPFLYRRHQEIYEMGDPLLDPEYILNAELSYARKLGKNNVLLTGFYRGVDNAIYRVNRVAYDMGNPGGVLLRSFTNAGNQVAIGAELGVNAQLLNSIKLFVGGALYDFRVIADDELLGDSRNSRSTNWNIKTNLVWTILDPLKLTADYSIKSGTVTPQGEDLKFQALNVVLNFSPASLKNWNFSLKMLDVLGTNQSGGYTAAYQGSQILLRRDYVYDYEGQIVELGVSYSINMNGKSTKKKKIIGEEYF